MFYWLIIDIHSFSSNTYMKIGENRGMAGYLGLLGTLFLAGCQTIPEDLGGEAGPLFRRGIVSQSDQGINFKPCYVQKTERIKDHTGKLQRRLNLSKEPSFYTELSGDHLTPGEDWDVYRVHHLGGNQFTCNFELPENHFRASGSNPLWIADVRDDGVYVQNYGRLSQIIFPIDKPVELGNGFQWDSQIKGVIEQHLKLVLFRSHCRDNYDIEYEFSAEMTLNGQTFVGCARQGQLDKRTLPGLYSTELPGVRSAGRFISLDITSAGEVILSQDYRNHQPLIVQRGSWERLANGRILIHLTELDGKQDTEVLIFERDKRGGLLLKGYSSTYGKSGLRLERVGPERIYRKFNRS